MQPPEWAWLGRLAYAEATLVQEQLRKQIEKGRGAEILLLLEHDPVITLGRSADRQHVLSSPETLSAASISVVSTSRGGDVTYHGPGQLVGYPIFCLRQGVRAHLRRMAGAILSILDDLGIAAEWREATPGIWVGDDKICAFGVHVRHRIACHGFALNLHTDLSAFDHIIPCGLRRRGVTSVAKLLGAAPTPEMLAPIVAKAFEVSFDIPLLPISCASSRLQIAGCDL